MTRNEAEIFSSTLSQKYRDVTRSLLHRDEITMENAAETLDQVQLMGERELVSDPTINATGDGFCQIRRDWEFHIKRDWAELFRKIG